jgi:hypothetical protein
MYELIRNVIFIIAGIFTLSWFISDSGGWSELAEKYRTENSLPETFLIAENQRISFKSENKSGVTSLTNLGIGVSDYGLYLSNSSFFAPLNLSPALLIPWSDIAYRKIAATNSLREYYTFYLGNPRIVRFSINSDTIDRLEQDYGESIFVNKLGEPE